jgi:hypothetical protein
MTMEHDDPTDSRSTDSTAADSDRGVGPEPDRKFPAVATGLSPSQALVAALAVAVAVAGVAATVPAAAGLPAIAPSSPVDSGAASAAAIETAGPTGPTDRPEISGGFSRQTYTGIAGDPIDIRHAADNTDGAAYLLIGGNRLSDTGQSVGFLDVVKITGQTTTINTRTIGTSQTNVQSCARDDVSCDLTFRNGDGNVTATSLEGLDSFAGATAAEGLARPLVPQRYRLAITDGSFVVDDSGIVTPTAVADQADLVLEKPSFRDDVEVFTSIDPSALDGDAEDESLGAIRENGLDRTAVTKGNRIVLGFESTGIWGALSHFAGEDEEIAPGQEVDPDVLDDLLSADEGVSLRVRETNPGRNQPAAELDISRADPEDVRLFIADATELETPDAPGRFYLVIDTSDGDHFTENPEPGDEFAVEFALEGTEGERYAFADNGEPPDAFAAASGTDGRSEQFPYWEAADTTVRAEATFTVRERYLRYDHVTDDGDLLVEVDDGRITGETSLLPVREMSATFVNDAGDSPSRTESPLEISDGNFTIDVDLDGVAPGTRLNYELYEETRLRDSRTVVVVGDADNPDELVIDDAPDNVTVTEGDNLSTIRAETRNAGGLTGEDELTLTVDNGTVTGSWGVRLAPNESRSFRFDSTPADLEPGTYPFSLRLDDDTHNGTLVVEKDPAKTTIDDDDGESNTADGNASDDAADGTDSGDDAANGTDSADDTANGTESGNDDTANGTESSANGTDASDSEPDDSPPDDRSSASGMLPLPFGTREALGGTVLVGAVHLLGHWV